VSDKRVHLFLLQDGQTRFSYGPVYFRGPRPSSVPSAPMGTASATLTPKSPKVDPQKEPRSTKKRAKRTPLRRGLELVSTQHCETGEGVVWVPVFQGFGFQCSKGVGASRPKAFFSKADPGPSWEGGRLHNF
jgi:hypothetical protein